MWVSWLAEWLVRLLGLACLILLTIWVYWQVFEQVIKWFDFKRYFLAWMGWGRKGRKPPEWLIPAEKEGG